MRLFSGAPGTIIFCPDFVVVNASEADSKLTRSGSIFLLWQWTHFSRRTGLMSFLKDTAVSFAEEVVGRRIANAISGQMKQWKCCILSFFEVPS